MIIICANICSTVKALLTRQMLPLARVFRASSAWAFPVYPKFRTRFQEVRRNYVKAFEFQIYKCISFSIYSCARRSRHAAISYSRFELNT